jgi:hypothetical protein
MRVAAARPVLPGGSLLSPLCACQISLRSHRAKLRSSGHSPAKNQSPLFSPVSNSIPYSVVQISPSLRSPNLCGANLRLFPCSLIHLPPQNLNVPRSASVVKTKPPSSSAIRNPPAQNFLRCRVLNAPTPPQLETLNSPKTTVNNRQQPSTTVNSPPSPRCSAKSSSGLI